MACILLCQEPTRSFRMGNHGRHAIIFGLLLGGCTSGDISVVPRVPMNTELPTSAFYNSKSLSCDELTCKLSFASAEKPDNVSAIWSNDGVALTVSAGEAAEV